MGDCISGRNRACTASARSDLPQGTESTSRRNSMRRFDASRSVCLLSCLLCVLCAFVVNSAPRYPDKANLLVLRDADGKEQPIRTAADWAKRREHILAGMQEAMGPLPDTKK